MAKDVDWLADLTRAGGRRALFREQSLWPIWVYRFGRRVDRRQSGPVKSALTRLYWILFRLAETTTGISLPKECQIGPGLRIWHFGGIFVHPATKIGANCTLRQGVTIGNRTNDDQAPTIGDNVEIGASAQVLGSVTIGHGARIGALTLVLHDLPVGCTAVGVPARVISPKLRSLSP